MSRRNDALRGNGLRSLALAMTALGAIALAPTAQAQSAAESPSAASIKNLQTGAAKEGLRDTKDTGSTTSARELAAAAKPAAAPKDAAVSTAAPRARRPVLRCWQEGRLVFEGSGITPSAQGQAAIELRNANGTALQVFDLRNGLCLLDHGND